ncbi:FAD/FMN-containing dehydrogenase [Nocardioides scoriae]|uniref:FAD/FMN-containing dehydrogenase n=1 Tax=Nocardioides scoriae TaxID=642780 RepID=A0A1H1SYM9_9ACTN|nr:FAD-binding oxidoreductase [Nocardioides scoriae]SDS52923.1 FAD/FMN-containing dehydrogenase [Nocardioides scoriae]
MSQSTTHRPEHDELQPVLAHLARTTRTHHLPGTPEYDAAVSPWNVAVVQRPVAVVAAESPRDVVAAVRLARRHRLAVAVQATGHGATSGLQGTLLVSTRALQDLHVDPATRVVRVGAGVRWDRVLDACAPHGLAPLAGSAPHVGVVGYTTGGGVGPLARTHGLASDRVRAFDVVTGDGELRRATATENPELFWALRGGKGLAGIVTAVELEVLPIAELYAGAVYFDGDDAPDVLRRWATWAERLPREATTSVALLRLPPLPSVPPPLAGRLTIAVRFAWTGSAARGAEVLAPVRAVAEPLVDTVTTMPYAALGAIHADPVDPMPVHEEHALLGALPRPAVEELLRLAGPGAACQQVVVELRQLGGALRLPGPVPSAYDARGAAYSLMAIGLGAPPVVEQVRRDAEELVAALGPWTVAGRLPNFAPRTGTAWLRATYSAPTLRRLARVSRTYDPGSVILGSADLRATQPHRAGASTLLRSLQALTSARR